MASASTSTEKPTQVKGDQKVATIDEKEIAPTASTSAQPGSSADKPTSSDDPAGAEVEDEDDDEDLPEAPSDPKGIIDLDTFQQIRDMDEDEDEEVDEDADPREFSRGIVYGFFDQAKKTFGEMSDALSEKDLEKLSSLGHFLKGSSAALGIVRVQANCEKIQHYGHKHDDEGNPVSEQAALDKIRVLLVDCKKDYAVAKAWLVNLYENE